MMEVRAKKSLGQHFLTDLSIAQRIADALVVERGGAAETGRTGEADGPASSTDEAAGAVVTESVGTSGLAGTERADVLEIGPGTGVLTQYLLQREDISLKMVEIDRESIDYLLVHFPQVNGSLIEADFLKLDLGHFFKGDFLVIGNFPYNISSQIFFKILEMRERVPQVVCMIQKEVAERLAEGPGSKTYGILSVLLQAWYDIEYLFTVGEGAFNPPPKVKSAVVRLTRNERQTLGCSEPLFKAVVKTSFNQRRKTMRNSLRPIILDKAAREGWSPDQIAAFTADPVFDLRPERLSVNDFIGLTRSLE